jgi:hypothetical protein
MAISEDRTMATASRRLKKQPGRHTFLLALVVMIFPFHEPAQASDPNANWPAGAGRFQVPLTVDVGAHAPSDKPVGYLINFAALLQLVGQDGTVIQESLSLVEVDPNGQIIDAAVPWQYDPFTGNSGTLVLLLTGATEVGKPRSYRLFFDTHGEFTPAFVEAQVELTDDVPDEGQPCYRIDTSCGTWFYQKDAGGFSSLVDVDGNDWLNFHPFGGSDGIYRGIPNLVHPDNIFHPGHANCTSEVLHAGPLKVTIHTVSNNALWECLWEIYPAHARLTVLQTADQPYWFLYEGTPGGLLDLDTDFCVRSTGERGPMTQSWTADIPGPEWLYFEDANLDRYLYFVHEEDDGQTDSFYQMQENMTVFGFGRSGLTKYLQGAPKHFTVGLADDAQFDQAAATIRAAYEPVTVTTGLPSAMVDFDGDGRIDADDLALLESGDPLCDLNGDAVVDAADRELFLQYYDPEPPAPTALEAWWRFDKEANDIAYDDSTFGRHGQIVGAVRIANGAPEFDGRDDFIDVKGYPGVLGTQARTVGAWIMTTATGQAFLSWGADEPGGKWTLALTRGSRTEQAGALHVDLSGASVKGETFINDGQWHHIAVTFAGGEAAAAAAIALFIDGQSEAVGRLADGPVDTRAGLNVTLGANLESPRSFFAGSLDEICLYSRALAASEIAALAAGEPID